jgi:hypothetical protein
LVTASCLPQAAVAGALQVHESCRWIPPGLQLFRHQGSARVIGQIYLAAEPDGAGMVAAAIRRLEQHALDDRKRTDEELILFAIESDYRASRVVEVEGWTLSEIEVAFCALAAVGEV